LYLQSLYFLFYTYGWFIKLNVSHYKEHILYLVCTSISSTSYASNFFVYILANKEFRHSLIREARGYLIELALPQLVKAV